MSAQVLRVALVAPLVSPIADPFLGGSQALLYDLATSLAGLGHQVTLFAADASIVPGVEIVPLGIDWRRLRPSAFMEPRPADAAVAEAERAYFLRIAYEIRRRAGDLDVVHNHAFDVPPFELLHEAHPRVCHTLHLPPLITSVVTAAGRAAEAGATMVTVSAWSQRAWQPHLGSRLIVNGVPIGRIPFATSPRSGWLWVGRLAPEKGLEDAMDAAEAAGRHLRVIGGAYDHDYHERVAARLRRHEVIGPLPRVDVFSQMGSAEALLMPVKWDEPFGLTAAEAMASGTPVTAYRRGALSEVIADGHTGYLVEPDDREGLRRAAERSSAIFPLRCREWVQRGFALSRMVAEYVTLYRELP